MDSSAGRSASRFLALLDLGFRPRSVLDVGCGRGVWLQAWRRLGVEAICGVDGDYVDLAALSIDRAEFVPHDLTAPLELPGRFDLVQCLEVAEHLPESAAETLVSSLVRHGDVVLFSAATPGQGGEQHVNEQPLAYWLEKFRARGFAAFDHARAAVRGVREIEPWYRYNALLFANPHGEARLAPGVLATRIAPGSAPREYATAWWRLRCAALRALPRDAIERLARLRHRFAR